MRELITNASWRNLLHQELDSEYIDNIEQFLYSRRELGIRVYPQPLDIFRALNMTPPEEVRIVVVGQEPYTQEGRSDGLAFSSPQPPPPSLRNILREANVEMPTTGDLSYWAEQGVLLLNNVLTVDESDMGSHRGKGWEEFTDAIVEKLNEFYGPIVFMLWGTDAKSKKRLITNPRHVVLTAAHPNPFSAQRGFFGCDHFRKANAILKSNGLNPIDWTLEATHG